MLIRPATISDCPAISAIYNHYVLHDTCTYQEEPDTLEAREAWFKAHGPQHPVIVAEEASRIMGWASLTPYSPRSAYRYTVENSIYIDPDARRRGIGKLLLQELIDRAKSLGHCSIIAGISAEQVGSLKIHENFGFIKVGHLKRVGFKNSQWLDVVYLQLELKTELKSIPEAEFTP